MEPGNQWFVTGSADRTIKVSEAENNEFIMNVIQRFYTEECLEV